MGRRSGWAIAALALLLVAGAWGARAAIQWTAPSTLSLSVGTPPVQWELGAGANKTRYFSPTIALSSNATYASGTLVAHAGADQRVNDVVRVASRSSSTLSVTLSATQITNSRVEVFTWSVFDGATLIGTLDARVASPTLTFDLPSGATYRLDHRVDMADGAGKNDSPTSFDLGLGVA